MTRRDELMIAIMLGLTSAIADKWGNHDAARPSAWSEQEAKFTVRLAVLLADTVIAEEEANNRETH